MSYREETIVDTSHSKELSCTPADREKMAFLRGVQTLYSKAGVLKAFFPQENQDSRAALKKLPRTITSFYHPRYCQLSSQSMQQESASVFKELKITKEEADYLIQCTRLQSQSQTWFEHRKGRLTASRFRAICHTSIGRPSESLIKQILQQGSPPKAAALRWGLENESKAKQQYIVKMRATHSSFEVKDTGLHIKTMYPYLGASPDGLITCNCCRDGVLEIKCPYSVRHLSPTSAPYLCSTSTNSECRLSRTHDYYYQIQGQMGITDRSYCDFVCWTPQDIFIERIKFDHQFFEEMEAKLQRFFVSVIFPRVLCGGTSTISAHPSEASGIYCYCQKGEIGYMILCDSPSCRYGWFHYSCVNLSSAPKDAWFCPDCRQ